MRHLLPVPLVACLSCALPCADRPCTDALPVVGSPADVETPRETASYRVDEPYACPGGDRVLVRGFGSRSLADVGEAVFDAALAEALHDAPHHADGIATPCTPSDHDRVRYVVTNDWTAVDRICDTVGQTLEAYDLDADVEIAVEALLPICAEVECG